MNIIAAILLLLLAVLAVIPAGSLLLALAQNRRAGELALARRLCGGPLWLAVGLSLADALVSVPLAVLLTPLGRHRPEPPLYGGRPLGRTPVLLVHGLYHNTSAWQIFRRRLARAGLTQARAFGYSSFGPSFPDIATALADEIRAMAAQSPTGRILLVGHSLGGMLIRAACAEASVCACVAGIVTLGAPHRGSTLAGSIAIGRLGRSLDRGGAVLRGLEGLAECRAPALSLFTPVDGMVQPLSGSLVTARQKAAGWREACVGAVSHVGLLYHGRTTALAAEFLLACAEEAAGGQEGERG